MLDFFDGGFKAPEMEEKVLRYWDDQKIFEKSLEKTKDKTPFTFYDGPPFATGLPHYGHILASTIKDVIPRYQTMRGHYVRRRWGWDCHGLPIEEIVERKLGISGKKQIEEIGIKTFNETCRSQVLTYAEEWGKMVRRMARWVEFDNSYKTMDRTYMESVWWAFKQIYDKGLVYEGRKVLLYCPRCEPPISNFEVAMDNSYKDVTEEAVTAKFKIKNPEKINLQNQNVYLLAWTTTPWTLPGNVALAVGKDIDYALRKVKRISGDVRVRLKEGDVYIHAADTDPTIGMFESPEFAQSGIEGKFELQANLKGADLIGLSYEPLFDVQAVKSDLQADKAFKVYAADFVNTEAGTGVVHTAVVYGEDDYRLGLEVGLPVVPLLDEKGNFNDKAPDTLRGQYFKNTERFIKKNLEERGLLFKREQHQHSYPHCWRCGTMLFYNAIPAWFINIQKIKDGLLGDLDEKQEKRRDIIYNWFPDHLKHGRYEKSVESAPDWNISRNRYWGNPIPVWKCESCGENKVIGSVAELGADVLDLHRPYIDEVVLKCEKCGGGARRVTEIFDSWVEAGSMPFSEYHYPFENKELFESRFPAQFVAEYIAQTRAWFYVMHVISHVLFGRPPFENVATTGTILTEDGSKMSKSKNNFPDPWETINKYGVDSLRFYLMNSVVMQADNLNFNVRDLEKLYRKNVMILWNVYNYFSTYAKDKKWSAEGLDLSAATGSPSGSQSAQPGLENVLDIWINARTKELVNDVTKYLDSYDTVWATRTIEQYVDDLSTWYLRRSRGRDNKAFFKTLYSSLITACKVIAPFMPFISESIYLSLTNDFGGKGEASVHLTDWPASTELSSEEKSALKAMNITREAASAGLSIRKAKNIPVRQPLSRLALKIKSGGEKETKIELSEDYLGILLSELNIKKVDNTLTEEKSDTVISSPGAKLVE
ncbi:MAG: isoleucine--tRNA ligase, partial [Candidatus Liptonbacteria bacterium]